MQLIPPTAIARFIPRPQDRSTWLFARDAAPCIGNVTTDMHLLDTGAHLFPVSVNDGPRQPVNSYVVSPQTTYIDYAHYEITRLGRPWLARPLHGLTSAVGGLLRKACIDRIVFVNNWLLSTNLYPVDWHGDDLDRITQVMRANFPTHAIAFRSLNRCSNAQLMDRLLALGFIAVPSRQVYLFNGRAGRAAPLLARHNNRIDAQLLDRSEYTIVQGERLKEVEYPRLEHLYALLYLHKYSPLNPQFSAAWMQHGQRAGWLRLVALRSADGQLDGVVGFFSNHEILSAPVVGYATNLPSRVGLYRLLTQLCLQEAIKRQCLLNFSSGAAHFKRLRGGQAAIEYTLVYVRHLPRRQRHAWQILHALLHSLGIPIMRRCKL